MSNPAVGNAVGFALGLERLGQIGVPDGGLLAYMVNLPLTAGLDGEEKESGQINPSGFLRRGIAGGKSGSIEFAHLLTPGHQLELLEHVYGKCTKSTLESGVYQYDFEPLWDGHIDTSFWGYYSLPPVERELMFGIKFGELELDIGDNQGIPVRAKGEQMHGTKLGAAAPAGANTGTYTKGPWVRGTVKDPSAGSIWFYVVDEDPALIFKVLQAPAAPSSGAWAAATTTFTVSMSGGVAIWQWVQSSADGLDLGIFDENKDPLEVIWPGAAADHLPLNAADVFEVQMPNVWDTPATTELTGYTRLTSAHWRTRFRKVGAPAYREVGLQTGKMRMSLPVAANRGNLSRYAFDVYRKAPFVPEIDIARLYTDTFFSDIKDRNDRIDAQILFEGRQLGTGIYRESLVSNYPSMMVSKQQARPANAQEVKETATLRGETNDDGDAPNTLSVITDRNWTPKTP